ncbi:MAG TPA: Ig-like domain-containing protein [Polyangiaceae bacterium]|nr:Ig-like domain-containing protein [Polyangiaceae bacterium]
MIALRSPYFELALSSLCLSIACAANPKARQNEPEPAIPSRSLALPSEASSESQFRVISAAPSGVLGSTDAQIQVVFSQPIRDLSLAENEPAPPITIDPPLVGKWEWVGTSAVTFNPQSEAVKAATRYRVSVGAETKSLSGETLGEAFQLEFETPRPTLQDLQVEIPGKKKPRQDDEDTPPEEQDPYDLLGDGAIARNARFALYFSLPVTPRALASVLYVTSRKNLDEPGADPSRIVDAPASPVEVTITRDEKEPSELTVTPKHPLDSDQRIEITLDPGLTSSEGPLPSVDAEQRTFHTLGPLHLEVDCSRVDQECQYAPNLSFNNAVRPRDLLRAISVNSLPGLHLSADMGTDYPSTNFTLFGKYQRETRYRLRVSADLKDVYGQRLGQPVEFAFTMGPGQSLLEIGAQNGFIEPALGDKVVFASTNLPSYEAYWQALTPERLQRYLLKGADALSQSEFKHELVKSAPGVNVQHDFLFGFERGLGQAGGALAISAEAEAAGAKFRDSLRVVHPTNLGVTALYSSTGGLAWVTHLNDGTPVSGVEMRTLGLGEQSNQQLVTDAQGLVHLPGPGDADFSDAAALVVARVPGDWSYARVRAAPQYHLQTLLSVHPERDLYRPGEDIWVKGWVRRETASATEPVPGSDVTLELLQGEKLLREVHTKSNAFGGFDGKLTIPAEARLQTHYVRARIGDDTAVADVRVGEYRPTEFATNVRVETREIERGQKLRARVTGRYLFGGAMRSAQFTYSAQPSTTSFTPPGLEGFSTDAWQDREALVKPLHLRPLDGSGYADTLLDEQGLKDVEAETSFDMLGPLQVALNATVYDLTRQAVTGSDSVLVHPGTAYVGVRLTKSELEPGADFSPEVLVAKRDGTHLPGVRVKLELYRYTQYRWSQTPDAKRVGECSLTSAEKPVSCKLRVTKGGDYFVLARATDEHKNPLFASSDLYVSGYVFAPATAQPSIALDKPRYRHGDTVHATVSTPIPNSYVLLSLEQDGVLWAESKRAEGRSAHFDVPVPKLLARNAELVARVPRPANDPHRDPAEPLARPWNHLPEVLSDRTQLELDVTAQHLHISVTPEVAAVTPGGSVKVRFAVKDALDHPHAAELSVSVVDEGVLSLTGFEARDPFDPFMRGRENVVSVTDTRDDMGWLYEPQLEDQAILGGVGMGFGSGSGRLSGSHRSAAPKLRMGFVSVSEPDTRVDFRTTPYFNPSLVTDAQGNAEITVKLSQLLTSFRISAIAVSRDDYFGVGAGRVETRQPLMARPTLPRFLRVGDRFDAGVVVSSADTVAHDTTVSLNASGITLNSEKQQQLRVGPGESVEARFHFGATDAGTARFEFGAIDRNVGDRVRIELPVTMPVVPQAVALYGKTDSVAAEAIGDLSSANRTYGELRVTTAATALVGLEEGFSQLIDYPYGCTEQLSSRLLPLLPLQSLAKDFGVPLPSDVNATIRASLDQISRRQNYGGGFGLWDNDPESHPWVTAYAYYVLDEARVRGWAVDDNVLSNARQYLTNYVEATPDEWYRPSLAFIAFVLSKHYGVSNELLDRLMNDDRNDALFVKALILETLTSAKLGGGAANESNAWRDRLAKKRAVLQAALEAGIRLNGNRASIVGGDYSLYKYVFDSETRTQAMVLSALLAANPKHPLAESLARGLLDQRKGGQWRSTQETAFALLALDRYRHDQEAVTPNFSAKVTLGSQVLGETRHQGRSLQQGLLTLPMAKLPAAGSLLAFRKQGEGTLFYQALLRYAPNQLPSQALDHGFSVTQNLYPIARGEVPAAMAEGYAPGQTTFSAGSTVLAQLTVTTPIERDFVVIESPLPAGLEAIDTSFEINRAEGLQDRAAPVWGQGWSRRELHDDRVLFFMNRMPAGIYRFSYVARATTFGSFIEPPARAEEMYSPEHFGRTPTQTVTIQ